MDSKKESKNNLLPNRASLQGKRKRKRPNKSGSSECNSDKEEKGVKSLWYWSNYYKTFMWQCKYEVEHWKAYARSLECEKMFLLQELRQLRQLYRQNVPLNVRRQMYNYPNRMFNTFTRNQACLKKSVQTKTEESGNVIKKTENVTEEAENENETEEAGNVTDEDEISEEEEEEEIEFEVSEEMMKFFEESFRRKLEMKRLEEKKAEEAKKQEVKKLQEAHELREKEMKLLYGEGSSMIIGMETAVQLSFDKYCDLKSPPYWPNIPLNL